MHLFVHHVLQVSRPLQEAMKPATALIALLASTQPQVENVLTVPQVLTVLRRELLPCLLVFPSPHPVQLVSMLLRVNLLTLQLLVVVHVLPVLHLLQEAPLSLIASLVEQERIRHPDQDVQPVLLELMVAQLAYLLILVLAQFRVPLANMPSPVPRPVIRISRLFARYVLPVHPLRQEAHYSVNALIVSPAHTH